jgi:uncharacterized repeat protein (TIGR03803 family)
VQGTDGNFYGTTYQGGTSGYGTVFQITPAGTLTTLHSFANSSDGGYPDAGLVQGTDGNFYGTTANGGTSGYGTVFQITPAGTLTTLHSFSGSDGRNPYATLVQGTDGNFYGTTANGGTSGAGTVFKITPAGTLTTLHSFSGTDGSYPQAGLVQGTDGNFYGTTSQSGPLGGGVVFRLTPGPGPAPTVTGVSTSSGPVSGGTVVMVSGTEFQPGATVSFGGTAATGVTYISATTIYALTPVHAAGAVTVTVTNPDLQAGSLASAYTYICSSWTPTAFNGGPYCAGSTISLSTPTVSGATYSWTGPNSFTSAVQNPTISNATVAKAGTYSVTVTVAGCTSAASDTTVVVNTVPTPTASNTGPYCVGATIALLTPPVSGATYSWTGPNSFTSALQNPTIPAATTAAWGTYSVTVTVGGCTSAPGATNLVVNDAVPATPTITAPASVSAGATGQTASVTNHAGSSYTWGITNGTITAGQGTSQITFTAGNSAGSLTLTAVETAGGCQSATSTVSVSVTLTCYPLSTGVITPGMGSVTVNTASNCTAGYAASTGISLTANPLAGYSFTGWSGSGGTFSSSSTNPTTFTITGNATVTATFGALPGTPVVTGVLPRVGPVSGGTRVTLTGTGFQPGATITIGGTAAGSVVFVSSTSLTATTPPRPVGPADVAVTNPGGAASLMLPNGFLYTTSGGAPRFYTIVPCRVLDTRNSNGPFGGPPLAAGSVRSFSIPGGSCSIPADAAAVVLNATIADATDPGTLTIFPGSGPIPGTNTISFVPGKNRANNVVLGLVGGVLTVKNFQSTGSINLIVDVNGYFK